MAQTAAEYQIAVKALWDGTKLEAGTGDAETAVKDLATQVDTSTDKINSALRSMDDGVSSSMGAGGTIDHAAGTTKERLGEVGRTASEELPMAFQDLQSGAASAAQGLASAFSSLGPLGIGIGSAFALFAVFKQKAEQSAQDARDAVNKAMESIAVTAKTSNEQIIKSYEKTLTFENLITKLGDDDPTKGFGVLADHAKAIGVSTELLAEYLNGKVNPATKAVGDRLKEISTETQHAVGYNGQLTTIYNEHADEARKILDLYRQQNQIGQQAIAQKKTERDYLADTSRAARDNMQAMQATADAYSRARANAADLARITQAFTRDLTTSEARAAGIANKLQSAARYYGGLPGSGGY